MDFNLRSLTLFLIAGMLVLPACADLSGKRSIKLAHGLDTSHPVHKGMEYLAARVAERSGGKLKLEIYPNGQLGTERQCLELLQIGSLGMTKVSAAVLENFAPAIKVLSLPYIFRDTEHAHSVLDSPIGEELLQESEPFYLRGLCFYDAGNRSFYTKDRPVRTPEDLKGLKIRVQESVTAMNMVRSFGGAPTPISWGELYTALQQGVVDGAENNPPSLYTSRHYEVCKYYSLNEHTFVPDILIISTIIWERLSDQERQWLQEAAAESVIYQRKVWKEAEQEALAEVRKAGVEIITPDKAPFMEMVEPMLQSYRDDPPVWKYIERIKSTGLSRATE